MKDYIIIFLVVFFIYIMESLQSHRDRLKKIEKWIEKYR
jgi:hypothetical protein